MDLFTRSYEGSLPPVPAWPSLCLRLRLTSVDDTLASAGPHLLRFARLRELFVGWYAGQAPASDTLFPPELAQLRTLRRVSLLNLPVDFPAWVMALPTLRYLSVRGTNVTHIPEWIYRLKQLHTLRVENCALTTLPTTLRHMTGLRDLSLTATQLRDFDPAQFPPYLKRLSFYGSGYYVRRDVARLQQALPNTRIGPDLSHPTWPPESR